MYKYFAICHIAQSSLPDDVFIWETGKQKNKKLKNMLRL